MGVQSSYSLSPADREVPSKGRRGPVFRRLATLAATIGLSVTVVWSLTGPYDYYWPAWVWLGLAIPFAVVEGIWWAIRAPMPTRLSVHLALAAVVEGICVYVWLMTGLGYPWPLWPLLGLVISLATHALIWPPRTGAREKELEERVGALTTSRRSVLEIQERELRRVERDLHDGAQARLVSLGMNLGLAEQLMDTDPYQAKGLLADARVHAGEALSDLRDLVRGIHPPVLADRGLEAAIRALVVTLPIPVEVTMDLPRGAVPDPVESALYFAVAESMANVVKHSGANKAWIRVEQTVDTLSVVIGDDGRGGADADRGSGLVGICRRLAAFDGTLSVVSPQGGPTILRMDIPCERSSPKTKPS
jgi:signal transduction histidine kinase